MSAVEEEPSLPILNLRKIFRVKHPEWKFKGLLLWEELAKIEMKIFRNELSAEQLKFIKNAVEQTKEVVDEYYEHHELAYLLTKNLEKMGKK